MIEVDNLEELYRKVTASGYPISSSLQERSWGARDFRVVDPEGYYIRFTD